MYIWPAKAGEWNLFSFKVACIFFFCVIISFHLSFLFSAFFHCFSLFFIFFFFYFICRFLGRSDRSFAQELQYVFLNKCLQSFRTTLDAKWRTLKCLPRGLFPFYSRLRDCLTRPPLIFSIFLLFFFSFYIVGEVLYQRIADFNLCNPTNHFYEWTIFDLFTRVISMRYFKRIEREVLMSTFFFFEACVPLCRLHILLAHTESMIVKRERVEKLDDYLSYHTTTTI